ncbi:MAG: alternative ribosome rescue aminoacyl-tRNA hydrolase ArfB [Acidobacteriota bacterium]|jgi:ribosome-associated protein
MTEKFSSIEIPQDAIRFEFIQSSGPGGQNVNKVATAVQLRFDARNCRTLSPEVRERLYRIAGKSVNSAGEVIIEAKRFRTQQRNREDALDRLTRLIQKASVIPKVRRKSHPTETSKLRRLNSKRHRSEIKKLRQRSPLEE